VAVRKPPRKNNRQNTPAATGSGGIFSGQFPGVILAATLYLLKSYVLFNIRTKEKIIFLFFINNYFCKEKIYNIINICTEHIRNYVGSSLKKKKCCFFFFIQIFQYNIIF